MAAEQGLVSIQVCPLPEELAVIVGGFRVSQCARHFFAGSQCAEVVDSALRVRSVKFHVVGVVLDAIHDAAAAGVPPTRHPGEGQTKLHPGPDFAQPGSVARKPPVQVDLHDLAHLAIGGGVAVALFAVGKHLAMTHGAAIVFGKTECGFPQRTGERGEQMLGGGLVVPDVRAVPEAAAAAIVAALEAVEFAIGGTEGSLRHQRGKVGHGAIAHGGWQSALAHGGDEAARAGFQIWQFSGSIIRGLPCVLEAGAIVIAEDGIFIALRRIPTGPRCRTIGETPRQHKGERRFGAGSDFLLQT